MENSTVLIRDVQQHELPQLLALLKAKTEFDGVANSLVATIETLAVAIFSHKPMAKALVAVSDGSIVGMATYYSTFSSFIAKPCLWLDDLFVDESHRSQGIGKALVAQLCRIASEHGCGRIDWVVAADNDHGQGFYSRMGATIFETVRLARLDERAIQALADEEG